MLALKEKRVCVSTGLHPEYLYIDNNVIFVKVCYENLCRVDNFEYRFIGKKGELISRQISDVGKFQLTDEEIVRVEVISENGAMIFFQPIYKSDYFL